MEPSSKLAARGFLCGALDCPSQLLEVTQSTTSTETMRLACFPMPPDCSTHVHPKTGSPMTVEVGISLTTSNDDLYFHWLDQKSPHSRHLSIGSTLSKSQQANTQSSSRSWTVDGPSLTLFWDRATCVVLASNHPRLCHNKHAALSYQ